jgi:predicted DNA-binding protein (MmcQ/YjbR family)
MDTVEFREYCLRKPKVTEGTPFGETVLVFKVAGKMFALMSLDEVPATANLNAIPISRLSCVIVVSKCDPVII